MLELMWPAALLLFPLPWLVYKLMPAARSEQAALRAPFFDQWQTLGRASSNAQSRRHWFSILVLTLIWSALLLAAARPVLYGEAITLPMEGRDLLLAVDISGSMRIEDMRLGNSAVDRLTAVKAVVGDFVERRQGDRLGLILFGSRAYLQAPLTFDTRTVKRFLNEAQIGFAGNETAIGDAIGLSIKRLRERPSESRVMILLTDGANTAGAVQPAEAAAVAADNNIRVYTIGMGADEMVQQGIFGTSFGSRTVNPSRDLDESTLQSIAELTGGRYFRARNPAELDEIYKLLDQLEPVDQDVETFRPRTSLFHWPLAFAFMLSLLLAAGRNWGATS
jgi:Ca-activated chloride channel family protein